ncbi:MAG: hypothetical protein RLZZ419_1065 [Pseudomonadota bacterium]|jgi:PAS domain S-box-containing protein
MMKIKYIIGNIYMIAMLGMSDETFRIFGLPKDTHLTYQLFLDFVHPADQQLINTTWESSLTGKSYDIEYRIIVNQNIKWLRERAELKFDEQKALLSGFGTTEDITDVKNSQEALQQERALLRQVIDAVPSVIFVKDREGRFLLGNQALARSYNTSPEALIGMTEADFNTNADEVNRFYENDLLVMSTHLSKVIPEEKVTHADGSVDWYSNTLQLLKAQAATDPKLLLSCNIIDRQVTHMARLLDDLLDVARIMQGKIRLNIEYLEIADIVNNALENNQFLIKARKQELILSLTTVPQWIRGDRLRLIQILSNLLNNAAKYTDEGDKITLSITREDTEIVIEIKDNGIGIAPDILPDIFDLFTQADHSLAHSQGGLGVGLTLVRQLPEIHGGTVTAASGGIGKGSVFTVRLPALSINLSTTEAIPVKLPLPQPKLRILIVDDYVEAAESLMMVLKLEGHEIEMADCGMKAIEQAQIFQPHVVLLDIGLPDLSDHEVAKQLRRLPETRDATLIALTGYGKPEDLELSESTGFNHYLLKPADFEQLSKLLAWVPNVPINEVA